MTNYEKYYSALIRNANINPDETDKYTFYKVQRALALDKNSCIALCAITPCENCQFNIAGLSCDRVSKLWLEADSDDCD